MKIFRYYPEFKFVETKPFTSTVTVDNQSKVTEVPHILQCKLENDDKFSYLYYKDIKRLYKIEDTAGIFGMILHDVRTNKYNMASLINGQLRFDVYEESDVYTKSVALPSKLYMFGYCVKGLHRYYYEWIDSMKIYNYNIPINTIDRVVYDRDTVNKT